MKISNLVEAWFEKLPPVDRYSEESLIKPEEGDVYLTSIDRYIQGWTGPKSASYKHMFVIPKIHNDRTYRIGMSFVCHGDSSHAPQVISFGIDVWHHADPKWVTMHTPPCALPTGRTGSLLEKELHKLYDARDVLSVYKLLLFEKEKELVDMILDIDHSCEKPMAPRTSNASPAKWPITTKMRVKCIYDTFDPDGPITHIGMVGVLLPSSMRGNEILWLVKFENEHIWDDCSEEYIRKCFEPIKE